MRDRTAEPHPLQTLQLRFHCPVRWASMSGDARTRFCGRCERHVFNLSAMTRSEASALIEAHRGNLCVRFYRRADGKIVTADCPPSSLLERWRYRLRSAGEAWLVRGSAGATVATLAVTLFLIGVTGLTFFGDKIRRSFGTSFEQHGGFVEPLHPVRERAAPPRLMYPLCRHDGIDHGPCTELVTEQGSWATEPLRRR